MGFEGNEIHSPLLEAYFTTGAKMLNIDPTRLEAVNARILQIIATNIEVIPTFVYF